MAFRFRWITETESTPTRANLKFLNEIIAQKNLPVFSEVKFCHKRPTIFSLSNCTLKINELLEFRILEKSQPEKY